MAAKFDYFVIFAEMRTGSNFLESNLNALDGVSCFGEAFNPHFIGYPNRTEILQISKKERDADPTALITAIRETPGGLSGFRYFHDHDPRVLDPVLNDPRCAKVILTRNPLDSYVSWKIAQQTGQWKLTNIKRRREAKATFDAEEFTAYTGTLQDFQVRLLNTLQRTGQTPFYLTYEDLSDLDVLNGLAEWLGLDSRLSDLDQSLTRQNPAPVADKVANPQQMESALAGLDRFNLHRTPNFEPRRGPAIPTYVAGARTPLLFLPIRGGLETEVARWMADLDKVDPADLPAGMNRKQLIHWMRHNKGHRRFTMIRHPLLRAHSVFCRRILSTGPGAYKRIRNTLRRQFKLPIPADAVGDDYSLDQHRAAFGAFLSFLRLNMSGQTPIRVDGEWGSQMQSLGRFADSAPPDYILREDEMATALPEIAQKLGHSKPPAPGDPAPDRPYSLSDIHDSELDELAEQVYQRDYLMLGFDGWKPS